MKNIPGNPWAFMADLGAIKDQIQKDVDRTNQEIPFFQKEESKALLTDILILWAGKNNDTQYKQGMNEICALIYQVFYEEMLENRYPDATDKELLESNEKLTYFLLDKRFIYPDVYSVFLRLMKIGVKQMYLDHESKPGKGKPLGSENEVFFSTKIDVKKFSPFYIRSFRIFCILLNKLDPELYNNLLRKRLEPPMYLLRWLRCLLCREFNIKCILNLWDAIFANISRESLLIISDPKYNPLSDNNLLCIESDPLNFLEFLCVAMIVNVREGLLEDTENAESLTRLLKYPKIEKVDFLVEKAIELKLRYQSIKTNEEKKENMHNSPPKKSTSNWISNSINFFTSGPNFKLPKEEKKTVKAISSDVKPVKKTVHEKVSSCIEILQKEIKKTKGNSELIRCIEMLEDVARELKQPSSKVCLLYTSPSPRDLSTSRMPSSA
eukprot:TRINITY_DN8072_c0_g2_i3.p1 TRINITY_DN8072_c0_g2~~TRINITY_DN8072_c0_g2_i3.p1  ORF type:complete len:467 (+),score=100.00 TRINITY_DN8072_c0_g2_i3:90-1403(+)